MVYSIAIDGPSGAGKSTIAKLLARELGFSYLDTGAMYRAITYFCLTSSCPIEDEALVVSSLEDIDLRVSGDQIFVNGQDVSEKVRSQEVTKHVSLIASYKEVRRFLVKKQQEIAEHSDIVLDGRDIGTVVLPEASIKFYLTASPEVRANRRFHDVKNSSGMALEETLQDIIRRDNFDSSRKESPLRQADDAIYIDSSELTASEVVQMMMKEWKNKYHV